MRAARPSRFAKRTTRATCFAVALVLAQSLSGSVGAQTQSERAAALLKGACIAAATPEAMIETGEKFAVAENWKLLKSGPSPLPMLHNANGPQVSFSSVWELPLSGTEGVQLYMSIVRPEIRAVRHSICALSIPVTEFITDQLILAVEKQFGPAVAKDPFKPKNRSGPFWNGRWFFTEEMAKGNCGKEISIQVSSYPHEGKRNRLVFADFAYPSDADWENAHAMTRCQS